LNKRKSGQKWQLHVLGGCDFVSNGAGEMASNLRSESIKVGELDIRYLTGGQGDPLVVLHGGGDSGKTWLQNAIELSKYYSIYVPDLPGFGLSQSMSDNFDLSEYVIFVEDFAHNLGLKQFYLVGHSLGGGIALHYALKFPQKIRRLVLVSSICLGKEIALWARVLSHPIFYRLLGGAALSILKAVSWLVRLSYAPFEITNSPSLVRMSIGKSIMTLKGQTTVLLSQLSELLVPTLLVWGAKDSIVPVSHAYAAAQLIPDCQVQVFKSCGHSVYKHKVHEFSQLLVKFLG